MKGEGISKQIHVRVVLRPKGRPRVLWGRPALLYHTCRGARSIACCLALRMTALRRFPSTRDGLSPIRTHSSGRTGLAYRLQAQRWPTRSRQFASMRSRNNGTTASARMSLAFLMTTSTRETRLWGRRNQLLGYPRRTSSPAKGCMFCATICTRNWPLFGESRAIFQKQRLIRGQNPVYRTA